MRRREASQEELDMVWAYSPSGDLPDDDEEAALLEFISAVEEGEGLPKTTRITKDDEGDDFILL